jgi:ABC-2 type transport system ATP-binding protein
MQGNCVIEARSLVRRYGDFAAVDHVSFSIQPGEVVGLLGHNGAGKTTIMKMLTGYLEPSDGQVLVDGVDVVADPLTVQAWMGYLPENLPVYPELTVADYLAYAAQLRKLDPAIAVPQAIAATRLEEKALDSIQTLSRGFKQRVGVAQAILHRPKFLILDEPSNGLDPSQIQQMRLLIRELAVDATIILSTHIMQEVSAVCDRALILRNGRLVVDERLSELQKVAAIRVSTDPGVRLTDLFDVTQPDVEIEAIAPGTWRVNLAGDAEQDAAVIARRLVEANAPIYQLTPEVRDLESIFKDVNEASAADDSHADGGQHAA